MYLLKDAQEAFTRKEQNRTTMKSKKSSPKCLSDPSFYKEVAYLPKLDAMTRSLKAINEWIASLIRNSLLFPQTKRVVNSNAPTALCSSSGMRPVIPGPRVYQNSKALLPLDGPLHVGRHDFASMVDNHFSDAELLVNRFALHKDAKVGTFEHFVGCKCSGKRWHVSTKWNPLNARACFWCIDCLFTDLLTDELSLCVQLSPKEKFILFRTPGFCKCNECGCVSSPDALAFTDQVVRLLCLSCVSIITIVFVYIDYQNSCIL